MYTFPLIGLHAWLGELAAAMFLWAFIELLGVNAARIKRIKIAILLGVVFVFASWIVGGYYYVNFYGIVKPIIKEGPLPWAHSVVTETKEHIFLFLPFLSLLTYGVFARFQQELEQNEQARKALLILTFSIAVVALLMAGMGFLISSGARTALEQIVLSIRL